MTNLNYFSGSKVKTSESNEISRILAKAKEQNGKIKAILAELRKKRESFEKKMKIEIAKNKEMLNKTQEVGKEQSEIDKCIVDQINIISEELKTFQQIEQKLVDKEKIIENLIKEIEK